MVASEVVIADTGFWLALLDEDDSHHARATSFHRANVSAYMTTQHVLVEACHLLATRIQSAAALDLIELGVSGGFRRAPLEDVALDRFAKLMKRYRDLPMDLTDASLVLLAEQLGHGRIVSTDRRDFTTYRWKSHKPFENLLLVFT